MTTHGSYAVDVGRWRHAVQQQLSLDFANRALEWRRILAEGWGTFLLVVVAPGADVVAARSSGAVTLGMAVVAPRLMVMAIIYFDHA
jgi:aquaporin Z